jgi:2-polyprenyl-3-methyl-5-hydroxy-6-metoxy-1,4-benzoquinol methylase
VRGSPEPKDEHAQAERFVASILPRNRVLKVLAAEAAQQQFTIRSPKYIVAADVLQAERSRRADADEHRVIDLERLELGSEQYDVVVCVNVLEHVRDPLTVFPVVWQALRSGGLFVLEVPNVVSLKGLVTRVMPWRFHRWFYARILRTSPETQPARSIHSFSLRPSALLAHAHSSGWRVEYFRLYEGPTQRSVRHRFGIVGWRWSLIAGLTRLMTFGALTAEETGIIAVLSKTSV